MNFRLTVALLVIVLVAVGGMLVAVLVDDRPAADAVLLDALAGLKPEDIDTVEITRTEPKESTLTFLRADKDKWDLRDPAAKVESFVVSNLVRDVLQLKPTTYPDLPPPAAAGLLPATLKITLRKGSEKSATLLVGDTTVGKDRAVVFCATSDRPGTTVAVKRGDLDGVFKAAAGSGKAWEVAKTVTDYRRRKLIGADARDPVADLQSIKLKQGAKELALVRSAGGDWSFTSPAGYGAADAAGDPEAKPETFTGVRPLLTLLTGLQFAANDDVIETPEAPEAYGLKPDDAAVIRIELTPKTGPAEVLLVGKKVDEKATPTKVFVTLVGDKAVFKVATDKLAAIVNVIADPKELRDRTLVSDLKRDRIDAADVLVGGASTRLRRVAVGGAKEWAVYGGPTDPQIASPAAGELIDALTRPRVAKDVLATPNDAAFAPAEVKAEVRLWIDGTEPGEPAKPAADSRTPPLPGEPKLKGEPAVTVVFGKADGDAVFARRTTPAGKTDFLVPAAMFAKAFRGRTAYLTPKFQSFPTNLAAGLAFNRGAEAFEFAKDDKPDPMYPTGKWTFAKPDRLKGQLADADKVGGGTNNFAGLIGILATLNPDAVAAEAPTPEQLKAFGLDPAAPRVRATVTLADEKDKLREYAFGADAGPGLVYARQGTGPVVTVPKVGVERFAADDLRDLTPHRVDRAKVSAVKFRGWKAAAGIPLELAFARKAGVWETTTPPTGFPADGAKIDALLASVTAPKPTRTTGGPPLPEHGLDPAAGKNPLEITLTIDGGPPIGVVLGEETDAGQGVFATFTTRPGEVVALPVTAFRPYLGRADYLKK